MEGKDGRQKLIIPPWLTKAPFQRGNRYILVRLPFSFFKCLRSAYLHFKPNHDLLDIKFAAADFEFPILFEDDHMVVINKPPGILTHPTKITEDKIFISPLLERQMEQKMYPIHRLDRATTGVLLFAKDSYVAGALSSLFREKLVEKTYLAIVRGYLPEAGEIEAPLFSETKQVDQDAHTIYKRLAQSEMPWAISRYPTARFSLLELKPQTGRHHQLRKHMAKLRHPIIGDRRHGDVKHNNFWRAKFQTNRMWLHASRLKFKLEGKEYLFSAPLPEDYQGMISILSLHID